jgi:hypothetical protein
MNHFSADPAVLAFGTDYLHIVGTSYGLFGLGLALFFASQGAGRMLWPLAGSVARVVVVAGGGWVAVRYFHAPATTFFFVIARRIRGLRGHDRRVPSGSGAGRSARRPGDGPGGRYSAKNGFFPSSMGHSLLWLQESLHQLAAAVPLQSESHHHDPIGLTRPAQRRDRAARTPTHRPVPAPPVERMSTGAPGFAALA